MKDAATVLGTVEDMATYGYPRVSRWAVLGQPDRRVEGGGSGKRLQREAIWRED
jgi:hypothetical protein